MTHLWQSSRSIEASNAYHPERPQRRQFWSSATRAGFSMIELVVALGLFSTCFLFVVSLFPVSMQAIEDGRLRCLGLQVAEYQMEQLVYNFSSGVYSTTPSSPPLSLTVNGITQNTNIYSTAVTVSKLSGENLYDVRVVTQWTYSSQVDFVQLETVLPYP